MRKLAVLLCVLLSMTPLGAMAETGEEMAAAIAAVRERVDIPSECTAFSGHKNVYNDKTTWEFSWETEEKAETMKSVRVQIGENGIIGSVHSYENTEVQRKQGKLLPEISPAEAENAALLACEKINPSLYEAYREDAKVVLSGDCYHVSIPRKEGGIPVYNNGVSLRVSIQTGKVESYALTHTETALFSDLTGAMETENAEAAFLKNGYMKLWYRPFEDGMRLVYVPGQAEELIDAKTGAPFTPKMREEVFRNEAPKAEATLDAAVGGSISLTPQERKAVEEAAGLISYEEATEILKNVAAFGLPKTAALESGSTYKTEKGRYILRVSLKLSDETEYRYTYGELDGNTGEILSFYSDRNVTKEAETTVTEETARKTYEAFMTSQLSEYKEKLGAPVITCGKQVASVLVQRKENDVPVYGNSVRLTVTPEGLIEQYTLSWDKTAEFESSAGLISEAEAYAALFEKGAPRLSWYAEAGASTLIYAAENREFAYISAKDGTYLTYGGKPFIEKKQTAYADIHGHYAEEAILALSSVGAALEGEAFLPDNVITQKEYVALLSNCVMEYYPLYEGTVDEARLYSYAINRGILPKDEEAPEAPLTREMAAAYLLRAMGYKDFASIPGIFRCDFTDSDAITPAFYGYVSIARGLGIVNGMGDGAFYPQRHVTRGEAAVMIYNYLK